MSEEKRNRPAKLRSHRTALKTLSEGNSSASLFILANLFPFLQYLRAHEFSKELMIWNQIWTG